ncbi:hypothetical protein ACFQY4_43540 [Catellatospora bangladeshensis]|uniref:hypothetical protein n=1 Tax=Catellatospora bangladeshensis TaxID=310355 RepID=UPI00361B2197
MPSGAPGAAGRVPAGGWAALVPGRAGTPRAACDVVASCCVVTEVPLRWSGGLAP